MKQLLFIFLIASISLFSQDEKRLALVIGNANYEKGELKNPVNDARLIASTLDSLDFDVILKENLENRTDFIRSIREFGNKRSEYDVAFVYYAGHGIQVDDENFLLPTKEEFSSEEDVLDFGVSVQNIMRYLTAQTNEVNILILDACRDNPFESNWNTTRSLKGGGLAKIPPPTGSLIAFSTDSGQTAPDGDGENSIYSLSLAKNMLLEDTSIDQVFRNVRAEVLAQTDGMQRPVEATQLTGQTFYLNPKSIDRFLATTEGEFNSGNYEKVIFSILNDATLVNNTSFLDLLIKSHQILGKNDELDKILEKILKDKNVDVYVLEIIYEYYSNIDWDKSYEIITRIFENEDNLINKIRKDYYEYLSYDYYYTDNISKKKLEEDLVLSQLLKNLKENHKILTNKVRGDDDNELHQKYLFKISDKIITYNFRRLSIGERTLYINSGLNSIKKLIELNPENPRYYERYAHFIGRIEFTAGRANETEIAEKILSEEFLLNEYDIEKITTIRDSLIEKAYNLNKLKNETISLKYFDRIVKEYKSKFYETYDDVLKFINTLIEENPNNINFLEKRVDFFSNNKKFELEISDRMKILSLRDSSKTHDIISDVAGISYTYIERLNKRITGIEFLQKYINEYKIDEIEIESMSMDEKYTYGDAFNTLAEFYFSENNFIESEKYFLKTKEIWNDNNKNFVGKGFSYFFEDENEGSDRFYNYMETYGYEPVINYLVNIFAYYSGSNLVESYINWINSDYKKSVELHEESLFYNDYLGHRIYFDYMNLILHTDDKLRIEKFSKRLDIEVDRTKDDDWTGARYQDHAREVKKFIFKSKQKINDNNEIEDLLNNEKYGYLFRNPDWRDIVNIDFVSSDEFFIPNTIILEILNLLVTKKMFNQADELIDKILNENEIGKINSVEFLYKASYIKYFSDKNFEAYALLSDVKRLLKSSGNSKVVEAHDIGWLDWGLILDFDGITIVDEDSLQNLERLIKE